MIAIVEIKGKQYRLSAGQVIRTLRVEGDPGGTLRPDRVLATIDGDNISIGTPALDGVGVEFEIVRHVRGPKIDVGRYQSKKRVYRRHGYRENISYLRVTKVGG